MDLGIYNINFVTGLFGMPKGVSYYPNMKKGVDTSGVLVLDYGKFKVNAICAKDCKAPLLVCIQGDKGYIRSDDRFDLPDRQYRQGKEVRAEQTSGSAALSRVCRLQEALQFDGSE